MTTGTIPTGTRVAPARSAKIPLSWKKAFGILRGKKPDPLQELKKTRREWDARLRTLHRARS